MGADGVSISLFRIRVISFIFICDGKSCVFFVVLASARRGVNRFKVVFRLSGMKGTEDVEAIVVEDHLLGSSVVLSFD